MNTQTSNPRSLFNLNEGKNLLVGVTPTSVVDWYFYAHASESGQCPKSFHLWTCMNMLAALAQDKWYYCKWEDVPIPPNIYTMLIGPSGLGKDTAIGVALKYLEPFRDLIRTFAGRLTHAAFTDFLCADRIALDPNMRHTGMAGENLTEDYPHSMNSIAWVVTPELSQSISSGAKAAELIKLMTAVYTSTGRVFEESTRQWGYRRAEKPCVSWLAGSTQEWLIKSIGYNEVKGGFASRILWVIEDYDISKMCGFPVNPPNQKQAMDYIAYRLHLIANEEGGEMKLSAGAKAEIDNWFANWKAQAREESIDKNLFPLIHRGHDLAIKLAMLLRIADMEDPNDQRKHYIRQNEMQTAVRWVEQLLLVHYPRLLKLSKVEENGVKAETLMARLLIKMTNAGRNRVDRKEFLKQANVLGLNAMNATNAVGSLIQMGEASTAATLDGNIDYAWNGDVKMWEE